jgi:hypothetical protein
MQLIPCGTAVVWLMGKKKKAKPMNAGTRLALRESLTARVTAMIARCEGLREAGKIEEARRILARIERLTKDLAQLEK